MFVDASVLVAILCREAGYDELLDFLDESFARKLTSNLAIFEVVTALCRKRGLSALDSENELRRFLFAAAIDVVPIADAEGRTALSAFARYGKGRGHPAQLNMGDCFAYACARTHDVPLLFLGEDFSKTDIRSART